MRAEWYSEPVSAAANALEIILTTGTFDSLMWYASRYCIGRHSYCSATAHEIWEAIVANRDALSRDRLEFFARDIRAQVSDVLRWHSNMSIENTFNSTIVYDAYTLYLDYMRMHPDIDAARTKFHIDCVEGTVDTEPMPDNGEQTSMSAFSHDSDLNQWVKLADCIDRQFTVTCENKGKKQEYDCVRVLESAGGHGDLGHIEERY